MTIVKLQTQVTLDGYLAGPAGEMDWMSPFSADMGAHVGALMAPVRHLLLGRRLAEGFIAHWAARPDHEPDEATDFMNDTPKVVISRTLTESPWPGVEFSDDLGGTVARLKAADDGDVLAYGGGNSWRASCKPNSSTNCTCSSTRSRSVPVCRCSGRGSAGRSSLRRPASSTTACC